MVFLARTLPTDAAPPFGVLETPSTPPPWPGIVLPADWIDRRREEARSVRSNRS